MRASFIAGAVPVDTCLSIFFANFWARQDYACDRGDLVFFYRQYERLMDHWRRVLPPDRFTEVQYETLDRRPGGRDAPAHRFLRARLERRLPRARAQRPGGEDREPVAGAPAGLRDVDRALAALRAVARGTARIIGERGNRSRAGAAVKGRCRPSRRGAMVLGPRIDPAVASGWNFLLVSDQVGRRRDESNRPFPRVKAKSQISRKEDQTIERMAME